MFDRFSDEAKGAMNFAHQAALSAKDAALTDMHILIGSCRTRGSLASRVLLACGQDPVEVCARAEAHAAQHSESWNERGEQLPFTLLAKRVLELTMAEADSLGHRALGTHHLLLGVVRSGGPASELLASGGLKLLDARNAALHVHGEATPPVEPRPRRPNEPQ